MRTTQREVFLSCHVLEDARMRSKVAENVAGPVPEIYSEVHGGTLAMGRTPHAPPASEDGVFYCSEQLRLTVDSGAPSRINFFL